MPSLDELKQSDLSLVDRWILARLSRADRGVESSPSSNTTFMRQREPLYRFFWHEFCDWYLEMIKLHPEQFEAVRCSTCSRARCGFCIRSCRLSPKSSGRIPHKGESIVIAAYPEFDAALADPGAESQMEMIQDIIVKVRNIRSEMNVETKKPLTLRIATPGSGDVVSLEQRPRIHFQARQCEST